jgi:putative ABC transport system permease protein
VFGLVPALRAARLDLQQTLRDGGRESRGSANHGLRRVLVVGQLCLTMVLLIAAGLLIRSSMAMSAVSVGFDTHNLLVFGVGLPSSRYAKDRIEPAFEDIERTLAAIPGVKSVGRTQTAPIYGHGWDWTAKREGSDGHDEGAVGSNMRYVSPNYFTTLGLPLLRGRPFSTSDAANAPKVAIVSRGLAERLWPGQDPIGKRISNGGDEWREIVGMVGDMRANGVKHDAVREMYMPVTQANNGSYTYLVRGNVPVATLLPSVRRAISTFDPLLAIVGSSTMDDALGKLLATDRFTRWLLTLLGITGLVLAVVGVYGVIAYFVTQRRHEMGVRIALGAPSATVQWLVVRQGLLLALLGVAIGVPIALAAMRLLQSYMFGVTTHDAATFVVVAALLAAIAIVAGYIPARRATRIDPLEALRAS